MLFGLIAIASGSTQLRVEAAPQPLTVIHQAPKKPHEFEIGHSISDETVSVLDQWLRRQLARK